MIIKQIGLENFRAHESFETEFAAGINMITGPNGIGKTNVLEAIHYLCLTKSFVTARDNAAIRQDCDHFVVRGQFSVQPDRDYSVALRYSRNDGKQTTVNRVPVDRLSAHVGKFPVVIFSPDDYGLTAAGPDERRRFVNTMLCQAYNTYLVDLQSYRHALRQRNSLLQSGQRVPGFEAQLEAWTNELVKYGARVTEKRLSDIRLLFMHLESVFDLLKLEGEIPHLNYRSVYRDAGYESDSSKEPAQIEIAEAFFERLVESRSYDISRGRTSVGPHRDELEFSVNGRPLRNFASQGQHRTFAMALKIAQFEYLSNICGTRPVFLLDDAFDHLDPDRIAAYIDVIRNTLQCQAIISTANPGVLDSVVDFEEDNLRIQLSGSERAKDRLSF